MMRRIGLIARREILAYATLPSFWLALLIGPVLIAAASFLVSPTTLVKSQPSTLRSVVVVSTNPTLQALAAASLEDASRLEHQPTRVIRSGPYSRPATIVELTAASAGGVRVDVRDGRLSDLALALLQRDLTSLKGVGQRDTGVRSVQISEPAPVQPRAVAADPGRIGRFAMTVMLWLVLVGSLGMLLQAVVRERTNRALESLLSVVRPEEILIGKLVGVGALSVLVVAAWFAAGSVVALRPLPMIGSQAGSLLTGFSDIAVLAKAGLLFTLTFTTYGAALIALGSIARDVPAAQNLSRPVFGLLLLIFFVALAQIAGMSDASLPGLALVPPFTPFVLLLAKPGEIDIAHAAVGLTGMLALTAGFLQLGVRALRGEPLVPPLMPRRAKA